MFPQPKTLRVAMASWEIGRVRSGFGTKVGGLGQVVEELPPELVKAADRRGMDLEIVTLSPCFGHYDKSRLKKVDIRLNVFLYGQNFDVHAYETTFVETLRFRDGPRKVFFKMVYFWDEWQLNWTNAAAIYPDDPQLAFKMHAVLSQAMASYIKQNNFQVVHLHDYHVGLIPMYLGFDYTSNVPCHLTVHNATYQGNTPAIGGGYNALKNIGLWGELLFHSHFDHWDGKLNILKACMLACHESDGKITTVSGDWDATWGYAAELKENQNQLFGRAWAQKGSRPGEVFLPNRGLDLFEKLPIVGITNGMSDNNRAENLPELKASVLREMQSKRHAPLFYNATVQHEMLAKDHSFTVDRLDTKFELRRLLHMEAFGTEPVGFPVIFSVVGRLVDQKNLSLVADIIPRVLGQDDQSKFIILASAPDGDRAGKQLEGHFFHLAHTNPGRVYYNNGFNAALSKLILAGSDFTLIPSRFEPCGLVDYEAALLGTVPIARATGGLPKIRHCGYLYDWLDIRDRWGEANAFFWKVKEAIDTFRHSYDYHKELMRRAMTINASWDASADQYIDMYLGGLMVKHWRNEKKRFSRDFAEGLGREKGMFARYFKPSKGRHVDGYDAEMQGTL